MTTRDRALGKPQIQGPRCLRHLEVYKQAVWLAGEDLRGGNPITVCKQKWRVERWNILLVQACRNCETMGRDVKKKKVEPTRKSEDNDNSKDFPVQGMGESGWV